MKKNEESPCELWDTIKQRNICNMEAPEEEREKRTENSLKEIMAENVPNLGRDMAIQGNEAHRSLIRST